MKVLVVDDNRMLASAIRKVLEDEGIEVMSANDGVEGYDVYLAFSPDMVITDIQMPRRSGVEMMHRIRNHNPTIKTVYMSGNMGSVRPFLSDEAKKYPVRFFEKPFSLVSLRQEVVKSRLEQRAVMAKESRQRCDTPVAKKKEDLHLTWQPCWEMGE